MRIFAPFFLHNYRMLLTELYSGSDFAEQLEGLLGKTGARVHIDGAAGSLPAVLVAALAHRRNTYSQVVLAPSKDDAYYMASDLEALIGAAADEDDDNINNREPKVYLFPTSYRKAYHYDAEQTENSNVLMRGEVLKAISTGERCVVVTYPEALAEKVVAPRTLAGCTLRLTRGMQMELDDIIDRLQELGFERVDFVVEGGQFAVRGGIVDVYSLASENPYRVEFFGDEVDSLRTFDAATQLSIKQLDHVDIVGSGEWGVESGEWRAESGEWGVESGEWRVESGEWREESGEWRAESGEISGCGSNNSELRTPNSELPELLTPHSSLDKVSLLAYFSAADIVWVQNMQLASERMDSLYGETVKAYGERLADTAHPIAGTLPEPEEMTCSGEEMLRSLLALKIVEHGSANTIDGAERLHINAEPQPSFGKQFDMLTSNIGDYTDRGYNIIITVSNESQQRRLEKIFNAPFSFLLTSLAHGFIDHDRKTVCYTDHEIFGRYHKYSVRTPNAGRESMTLKELFELQPGDFVTHIDYGVGRFSGLEKVTRDGHSQELIRLIYKGGDVLYISIHGLHKISRYVGREGEAPQLNRLGSNTWQALKQRTKRHVKDIARDLIALYAKRRASRGFAFSPDGEMQAELEASFIYEDTPDQLKATIAVKHDMEEPVPMDRLVCGDVGFGKTEVAIRAAFKACCDSKQVAVLVPSTILAFQHYNTFVERLKGMPVRVEYLNRFRTAKDKRQIYADVASGKIDILIGTHAITNKDLEFKDLGLLIIDEEQKFGVSVKEKLKQMKVGVDCLTLTATPIPRTLQFSLMGARDLSIIRTPPPNRQPIETELSDFNEGLIRDAIMFEMNRGGQTFFISNRVENLPEMAGMVNRLVPDARVAMAHGRMDGKEAEETLMRFLEGDLDVLVATSIVENGLDIPNANTMIINNAHQFGLSDLHQMRGRVGRSNRKAFCYMLVPSYLTLTDDAQRRLRAVSEFAAVGSGFNIAMRDLDIRGAGNILGAEQSGFISEVGYDMYHKILNEAVEELKESDFRDLFVAEAEERKAYVRECTIETDLEVLLPDDYVTSGTERLLLYKELNDLTTEEELAAYRSRLQDRFGPVPEATEELIRTITLRRMAKEFGIEKLVLKQNRMVCHLVSNPQSPFYTNENFAKVIRYAQANERRAHLKESGGRLCLSVDKVATIGEALRQITALATA